MEMIRARLCHEHAIIGEGIFNNIIFQYYYNLIFCKKLKRKLNACIINVKYQVSAKSKKKR